MARATWGRGVAGPLLPVLFILIIALHNCSAIKWLALAKTHQKAWNNTKLCQTLKRDAGLTKQQVRMCKQNLELMGIIAGATREAVLTCQSLFADRRWNCSSITYAPNFLADLTGGSREQAFVYSLSSAAITHAVSRACSIGATTKCGCGRLPSEPPPGDFKWGGCGDDLLFGLAYADLFASPGGKGKRRSKRRLVNGHNNAAGRKLISDSLQTACKCHGVSGSCSIKTCWKALPDLKELGIHLQKRYAIAVEVDLKEIFLQVDKKRVGPRGSRERRLVAVHRPDKRKDFNPDELIYYTKSPDYCLPDTTLGSLGTRGRECNKDSTGSGGCRSMCCGRGYTSHVMEMKQRCDCKYYWCCYVKCKTCTTKVEINRCR